MSRTKHLQVYQSAYAFSLEMYKLKLRMPVSLKHDLGAMIFSTSLVIVQEITIANSSVEKVKPLQKVLLSVESLWPLLKMAEDLKSISIHQYKLYIDLLVEIGSQTQSWLKWAKIKK